jgi:hypothetical protein
LGLGPPIRRPPERAMAANPAVPRLSGQGGPQGARGGRVGRSRGNSRRRGFGAGRGRRFGPAGLLRRAPGGTVWGRDGLLCGHDRLLLCRCGVGGGHAPAGAGDPRCTALFSGSPRSTLCWSSEVKAYLQVSFDRPKSRSRVAGRKEVYVCPTNEAAARVDPASPDRTATSPTGVDSCLMVPDGPGRRGGAGSWSLSMPACAPSAAMPASC